MRNVLLYKGWTRWAEHATEAQRQRDILGKMVQRMRNAGMYQAYASWADNVRELHRQQGVLERVALRMRNLVMCRAYATLQENAVVRRLLARAAEKIVLRWRQLAMVCFDERAPCMFSGAASMLQSRLWSASRFPSEQSLRTCTRAFVAVCALE
jgi:hypothetical protein